MRFHESGPWQLASHEFRRVDGQERALDPDPFRSKPSKVINSTLGGIEGRSRGLEGRSPELAEVLLIGLHSVPDIGRLIWTPFDVDEERQIAAYADRVEMIEEEEAIPAQEILDVVLR